MLASLANISEPIPNLLGHPIGPRHARGQKVNSVDFFFFFAELSELGEKTLVNTKV